MHIPAAMLHGRICPVTLGVAAVGVGLAAYAAYKSEKKPTAVRFAAVTILAFASQMLNFPVLNGTSSHLVGAVLAASLLGAPLAILAMSLVLAVQAIFFGDGGINALGANIINMSLIGAGLGGFLFRRLARWGVERKVSLGLAAFSSVVLAAAACACEIGWCGTVAFNKVMPAMLGAYALTGIAEAGFTLAIVVLLEAYRAYVKNNEHAFAYGVFGVALLTMAVGCASSQTQCHELPGKLSKIAYDHSATA